MPGEATRGAQIALQAQRIVDDTRHTRYKYPPYVIDDATGTYEVDCCGFVSLLVLKRIAPEHYTMIQAAPDWPVPQAYKYYEFFDGLSKQGSIGWRRIHRLTDSQRGDIIAWRLLNSDSAGDTGHVFIVSADPEALETGVITVAAYDSSNVLHYDDSRLAPEGQPKTGLGKGSIHFQVDPTTGCPIAFQFGPCDPFRSAPIAIGRLEPIAPVG